MQQQSTRSFRCRATLPAGKLDSPQVDRFISPCRPDARSSFQLQDHNLGNKKGGAGKVAQPSTGSLHRASFPQAQDQEELLFEPSPLRHFASGERTEQTSLAEANLPLHLALEGETSQTRKAAPPPPQLDSDKLELVMLFQLGERIAKLQQDVGSLAELMDSQLRHHILSAELGEACAKHTDNNNNNNNDNNTNTNITNNNTHNTNHTNNNNNNNDDNNKEDSRESSLCSLDLDKEHPESKDDLDSTSLSCFYPTLGVESSLRSLDQQEANLRLPNLGHKEMMIGLSLGSLIQQEQDDHEGQTIGTAWEPSLEHTKESFETTKPQKRVTFGKVTFAAYDDNQQNSGRQQRSSQLEQLEHKKQNDTTETSCKTSLGQHNELPNNWCKPTLACWNLVQQEHQRQQQQQTAKASEKILEHRRCINNNLREELSLGSLEAEPQATKLAYRSPKHNNNNNSILGLGTKNTAAYGILIDTGAAVSLAPLGFAQQAELQPLGCTLQLRSVTGNFIETFGRRTIQLVGSKLSLCVSFVIANVQHALLGMDALVANQLSLVRNSFNEFFLVNAAGATIQLQQKGHLLYLDAWPYDPELSACRGSSFQEENGSLLDDKIGTQEGALTTSGGACADSFYLQNLRQQQDKNTAALGTTALPEKGAKKKRRRRKKPAAKQASQVQCDKRSLEQQGQKPVATHLRNLGQLRIIKEIEIATEQNKESLGSMTIQELSLRILLTLSLRNEWLITTTRATEACSESALGEHLRHIGLCQNKMDQNIFSGDELVLLVHKKDILIGGTEMQQEELFCELSALLSLEQPKKLEQDAPISFCNRILEYQTSSHSINLSLGTCFVRELLCRHELENEEPLDNLDAEKPCQDAVEQSFALDACRQELYRHTVGELSWAAKACRPDLCFEVHLLTQSLENPTTLHEQQLHRVLRYLAGTLHHTLSLHTRTKMPKERAMNMELLAFSASSWTSPCRSTCSAYLLLWETPLIASCKTSWANNQEEAELQGVNFALAMAVHTRKLLQHLDMDQLGKDVHIGVRTTSFNEVLVTGRPIAMQLGLSRRNKHIQVGDQLQLSRVPPSKNLAHSLIHNPPSQLLLAKLRVNKGAAETLALSTVLSFASFVPSSSLVVGMVSLEHPKMESEQLRQLALKSESCSESLSKNLADNSLPSLTVPSLSLETIDSDSLTLCSLSFQMSRRNRFNSLTSMSLSLTEANLHSLILSNWSFPTGSLTLDNLSRRKDRLQSLTLQSLSLDHANGFHKMSFEQVSLQDGSLKETEDTLANNIASGGAETNSLPQHSFEDQLAGKEDGTNIFSQSFLDGILSLSICLLIFLSSFQLTCSALSFGICYLSGIFPKESLQPEELVAAYCTMIFEHSQKRGSQQDSFQKEKLTNKSFDNNHLCRTQLGTTTLGSFQLDLATSLSLPEFSQTRSRSQLQSVSFEHSSFEQRALHGAALFQDHQDQEQATSELSVIRMAAWSRYDSRGSFP